MKSVEVSESAPPPIMAIGSGSASCCRKRSESTFAIWLERAELIAVDGERRLVVAVPATTADWTSQRFGRLLTRCAARVGRELRFASEPEIHALGDAERRVQQLRRETAE